jgi:phosphoglycerate kinase
LRLPRSVETADVAGKHVLVRADLNVPLDGGRVADDTRIRASLPTLRFLLDARVEEVRVCSHLGRPKGPDPAFAIAPVAARLAELVSDDRVRVLENTRFDPGETKNDPETARRLAEGMDLYVDDAFGSAHRAHASTEAVAHLLPAYAGLLLIAELEHLGRLLGDVERPFVLVAGGAKVEDKLGVLRNLGGRADTVIVGGKMAEELRGGGSLPFPVEQQPQRRQRGTDARVVGDAAVLQRDVQVGADEDRLPRDVGLLDGARQLQVKRTWRRRS